MEILVYWFRRTKLKQIAARFCAVCDSQTRSSWRRARAAVVEREYNLKINAPHCRADATGQPSWQERRDGGTEVPERRPPVTAGTSLPWRIPRRRGSIPAVASPSQVDRLQPASDSPRKARDHPQAIGFAVRSRNPT
jgi:hypothetical protein